MPALIIPEPYRPGIAKLASLNARQAQRLRSVLANESPTLYRSAFGAAIATKLSGLDPSDIDAILLALIGLYRSRLALGVSIPDFSEGVARSPDLDFGDEESRRFKDRLETFLDVTPLLVVAKAVSVLTDNERSYDDSRILTDVRPIFGEDSVGQPLAAVILHTLRISYLRRDASEDFFVILDNQDLQQLRHEVERAVAKAKSLDLTLQEANITHLTIEAEE